MASTAISAQGSTLKIDDATPGTPDTLIGNLISYSGFDGEAGEIDVSNLSSAAKEFKLGLVDNGGFNVEWHVDLEDEGQVICREAAITGETKKLLLTLPNSKTVAFSALIKNATSLNGAVDSALSGTMSIKISGALEYA